MRALAFVLAAAFVAATTPALAARLDGDAIQLCNAPRQPSPLLRPSGFNAQSQNRDLAADYFRLRDAATRVLSGTQSPEVDRFLAALRDPGRLSFAVEADANTEVLFQQAPARTITINCDPAAPPPQYVVDMATAALIAEKIAVAARLPLEKLRADAVEATRQDAEALLKDGLAMWPWELWLNGLRLSEKDSDPLFRTQWVFMRPTAGIEIDTYSQATADLHASVMLEPVGLVRYRGNGYSHWWGASFVITSSTGRGAGIGGLLRWDNYVIGLTRHKGDGTHPDSTFLAIGVELYDVLNKKRADLQSWDGFEKLRNAMK